MTDIVSTDWVADRLDAVSVVDVRDAWEYDGIGHLPGAVNIPFDSFRAEEHAVEGGDEEGGEGGRRRWLDRHAPGGAGLRGTPE